MPLTALPGGNSVQSNVTLPFLSAEVEIKDTSAPVSAQAPMGLPLEPSLTRLYCNGERRGGLPESTALATAVVVLVFDLGTVVSSKYLFLSS